MISMEHCHRHVFEQASSHCHSCRQGACQDCTVEVRGLGTLCITCAVQKAGIRVRSYAY